MSRYKGLLCLFAAICWYLAVAAARSTHAQYQLADSQTTLAPHGVPLSSPEKYAVPVLVATTRRHRTSMRLMSTSSSCRFPGANSQDLRIPPRLVLDAPLGSTGPADPPEPLLVMLIAGRLKAQATPLPPASMNKTYVKPAGFLPDAACQCPPHPGSSTTLEDVLGLSCLCLPLTVYASMSNWLPFGGYPLRIRSKSLAWQGDQILALLQHILSEGHLTEAFHCLA